MPGCQEFPVPRHTDATKAAIKNAVDIVALVGEYLPLRRAGSKYKALCPFHDDHNPSLELNPERQSFKCWSCGAGGDVFDFVKSYEHVDFPEAMRMLADRAGIVLERPSPRRLLRSRGRRRPIFWPCTRGPRRVHQGSGSVDRGACLRRGPGFDGRRAWNASGWAMRRMERGWLLLEARKQGFSAGCWNKPDWSPDRKTRPGRFGSGFGVG